MKINKEYIFKRFFKKESSELDEKRKAIKIINENLQRKKIELKEATERANKFIEENTRLRHENGKLRKELNEAKNNIINSNEYKTLLEKYNELLKENNILNNLSN